MTYMKVTNDLKDMYGTKVGAGSVVIRPTGKTSIELGLVIETTPKSLRYIGFRKSAKIRKSQLGSDIAKQLKTKLILTQYERDYRDYSFMSHGTSMIRADASFVLTNEFAYDGIHDIVSGNEFHRYVTKINEREFEVYVDQHIHEIIQGILNA